MTPRFKGTGDYGVVSVGVYNGQGGNRAEMNDTPHILARIAFASSEATERLNSIVHPAVARDVGTAIEQIRLMPDPPVAVVLEVPLLVEALRERFGVLCSSGAPEGDPGAKRGRAHGPGAGPG